MTCLPGANAGLTALVLSGLPSTPFLFEGFLPNRKPARRGRLAELADIPATLVFYEAPSRVAACLRDMAEVLGERDGAVLRELTKKFEEASAGKLNELAEGFSNGNTARGEFVILCGPPGKPAAPEVDDLLNALRDRLEGESLRDAVQSVSAQFDLPRKQIYKLALGLKDTEPARGKGEE